MYLTNYIYETVAEIIMMILMILLLIVIICSLWVRDNSAGYDATKMRRNKHMLYCCRCRSMNIYVAVVGYTSITTYRGGLRKKSLATRTVYRTGRAVANMMTMGMYGFFVPKSSKYRECWTETTQMKPQKCAICQTCGNAWMIYER